MDKNKAIPPPARRFTGGIEATVTGKHIAPAVVALNQTFQAKSPQRQRFSHLIAEIDAEAIRHNCKVLKSFIPIGTRFCVAVKANAYGHGLSTVLPTLDEIKVDMVAVATVTEARQARELGWTRPLLLMGTELSIYHGALQREVADWLVQNAIQVTVLSVDDLRVLSEAASRINKPACVHLKLDTGLSRMGVDEAVLFELIEHAEALPRILVDGIYTHFASSDEPGCAFARGQLARFLRFCDRLRALGTPMPTIHAANSAAITNMPDSSLDMVRPGIGVYGYQLCTNAQTRVDLRPAMRVVSSLMLVKRVPAGSFVGYGRRYQTTRESVLGIVPVGYADGLDRRLSNTGFVTVCGELAPIIGKISMDQTIVDLTDIVARHDVHAGTQAVIIDNDPIAPNSVESMARQLDTIPYEIVTSISPRVARLPKRAGALGNED